MSNIKIAVAYHKPWYNVNDDCYMPIHVGANNSSLELGIQKDNEGDNISDLNPYYCELTAMYYIWKNTKADFKGLCHYRRFFCFKKESITSKIIHRLAVSITKFLKLLGVKVHYTYQRYAFLTYESFGTHISEDEADMYNIVKDYSIIVPYKAEFSETVREHFKKIIGEKPLLVLDQVMEDTAYYDAYNEMMDSKKCHCGNMSMMKDALFNQYCEFLFPLLKKHMNILMTSDDIKSGKYLRVIGYISEILTSVYITSQNKYSDIYYTQVYYVDEATNLGFLGNCLSKLGFFHPLFLKK